MIALLARRQGRQLGTIKDGVRHLNSSQVRHYVKFLADFGSAYSKRCVQSKQARKRHRADRQHSNKSSTSLFETPASSRRFFFLAICRYTLRRAAS
ncbi:hypothetical protein [Ralstonia syzygii]|uniref:hypothetical protein n=1 Tax=Ralstonia syzygii TaxID=28097 RepID=UPI0018D108CF|nr:hypothetical protein [Ralstonia syzygii]